MAETGAVKFVGKNPMSCGEVINYELVNAEGKRVGGTRLEAGYEVRGIPAEELGRWMLNQNFEAASQEAETAREQLDKDVATRINGYLVDPKAAEERLKAQEKERAPISELNKSDLLEMAKEFEVEEYSERDTKDELIEKIKAQVARSLQPEETTEAHRTPDQGTVTEGGGQEAEQAQAKAQNSEEDVNE